MTVGPSQPGLGWAATPTGLSTTTRSSSSYRIVMPSTGRGATGSPGGGGSSTSSQLPAVSRSPLPRARPSTTTPPASATSAAEVRDSPKRRDSAWSTRCPSSPSGTGRARCRPGELVTDPIVTCSRRDVPERPPRRAPPRACERWGQRGPSSGGVGALAVLRPRPVELDAAHRQEDAEDSTAGDGGVGDVEHREVLAVGAEDGQEVDDAAPQEPGIAEDAV